MRDTFYTARLPIQITIDAHRIAPPFTFPAAGLQKAPIGIGHQPSARPQLTEHTRIVIGLGNIRDRLKRLPLIMAAVNMRIGPHQKLTLGRNCHLTKTRHHRNFDSFQKFPAITFVWRNQRLCNRAHSRIALHHRNLNSLGDRRPSSFWLEVATIVHHEQTIGIDRQ